ncbi:SAV_2336 N-terminal domain-related protein, partial [Streptomyces sp. NPDC058955]|uniref:SAV_2336 N-terminal domain-related protein n=1 Tax=Streptomyces sp. NPDC058955 TaxID=3346678 RepID=UPI00368A1B1B
MDDDEARSLPEPFEVAEALWLHAYQTLAARLPSSDPPRPRPVSLPGLPVPGQDLPTPPLDAPGAPGLPGAPPAGGPRPGGTETPDGTPDGTPGASHPAGPPGLLAREFALARELHRTPVRAEPLPDLRDAPGIARRLRPLKQVVPSPFDVELDEEATAEHAAEDGLWLPYTRAADERRFDVVLVVDDHATMAIWEQTIAEFTAVLEQLGAFRDVRIRRMGVRATPRGDEAVLHGPVAGQGPAGSPAELLDRTGRRIVLVLTDALGPLWRTGAGPGALELWAAAGPTAVVHLLSQRDWHRTALTPRRVRLGSPRSGAANTELAVSFPPEEYDPFDPPPATWTAPVPVLELDADWLGRWAALVAGGAGGWTDASALLLGAPAPEPPEDPGPPEDPPPPTVQERIRRFRSHATPTAFRLATHLAAAVLDPRLVRDVRHRLVPEAQPVHVAELFLSGLVEQPPAGGGGGPPPAPPPPARRPRAPAPPGAGPPGGPPTAG